MGLAISTGMLADLLVHDPEGAAWFTDKLAKLNSLLARNGLPKHEEPAEISPAPYRGACMSFPYSYLHYLRRALAYTRHEPSAFAPCPAGADPSVDPWLDQELTVSMDSHLICHSDCEGFYVPIDFDTPLFEDEMGEVPGSIVGSTQGLLRELVKVAPLLNIPLDAGQLSDAAAATLANEGRDLQPLGIEKLVWFALYEAAARSLAQQTLIVFH